MRGLLVVVAIVLLGGCDVVWRIDGFEHDARSAPGDGIDSIMVDGPLSDGGCSTLEHDEDKDLIPDRCDNCPTVINADGSDSDGDGVGNACDPDASASDPDHIALYSAMTDLSQFVASGTPAVDPSDHAILHLGDQLTSIATAANPTLAIVEFQISSPATAAEPGIALGAANCSITNKPCPTQTAPTCLKSNGTAVPLMVSFGSITALELRGSPNGFSCSAFTGAAKFQGMSIPTPLASAPISLFVTGGTMTWAVANVIVYGH